MFLVKLKRGVKPFLEGARKGAALLDYPQEQLVVIKGAKVCLFVKLEIILPLLCCLLDPLTNRHCWVWNSITTLWIDSRTSQKRNIQLSAKQRSNNYLELSKGNVLGNMMLSHSPCFT